MEIAKDNKKKIAQRNGEVQIKNPALTQKAKKEEDDIEAMLNNL